MQKLFKLIDSWSCGSRQSKKSSKRTALKPRASQNTPLGQQILRGELGTLRPRGVDGKPIHISPYMCAYAFCQYVLRQIRAYAEKLADVQRSAAPPILAGRPGNEQRRANTKDIFSIRTTWPFHFAGDSGASLFGQRAWLSWRFLALLELPKLEIWELPTQSDELQNLIRSTRSSACSVAFRTCLGCTTGRAIL